MILDIPLAVGGLLVGTVVGLTGMGGGALMTPMLVFFFNVNPLTAISSDIVVSLLMKPVGAFVHLRRGTVNLSLVGWLCVGSMPAAFSGAWLISMVPGDVDIASVLKLILGVALLIAASGLVVRALIQMYQNNLPLGEGPARLTRPRVVIKPVPTIILGAVAGFMVGLTSVGAGSIIIVVLLMMYPTLKASSLVGTDLAQAIPLVAAAAIGHLLFGSFSMAVASSLLLGAIPGAWIGAQVSSRAPGGVIRRALAILLLASGLKLLNVPNEIVLLTAVLALTGGSLLWIWVRGRTKALAQSRVPVPPAGPASVPAAETVPAPAGPAPASVDETL
ncbi:MAG: sulfite exporter TauE/SafE family protein [Chloroflexota bacterium]